MGESSHTFLKNRQTGKTKQIYLWKWFVTRMMFTIHKKRFLFLKTNLISFFINGANRPGVNRPVRKMVMERIVPGGTGFGANRPVTSFLPLFFKLYQITRQFLQKLADTWHTQAHMAAKKTTTTKLGVTLLTESLH